MHKMWSEIIHVHCKILGMLHDVLTELFNILDVTLKIQFPILEDAALVVNMYLMEGFDSTGLPW